MAECVAQGAFVLRTALFGDGGGQLGELRVVIEHLLKLEHSPAIEPKPLTRIARIQ